MHPPRNSRTQAILATQQRDEEEFISFRGIIVHGGRHGLTMVPDGPTFSFLLLPMGIRAGGTFVTIQCVSICGSMLYHKGLRVYKTY